MYYCCIVELLKNIVYEIIISSSSIKLTEKLRGFIFYEIISSTSFFNLTLD
jgi:hypothetical protein